MVDAWEEIVGAYEKDSVPPDDPDARSTALIDAVQRGVGDFSVALLLKRRDGGYFSFPPQSVQMVPSGSGRLVNGTELLWDSPEPIGPSEIAWEESTVRLIGADGREVARLGLYVGAVFLPQNEFRVSPGSLKWSIRAP